MEGEEKRQQSSAPVTPPNTPTADKGEKLYRLIPVEELDDAGTEAMGRAVARLKATREAAAKN